MFPGRREEEVGWERHAMGGIEVLHVFVRLNEGIKRLAIIIIGLISKIKKSFWKFSIDPVHQTFK